LEVKNNKFVMLTLIHHMTISLGAEVAKVLMDISDFATAVLLATMVSNRQNESRSCALSKVLT
jgi:hypothetical protein